MNSSVFSAVASSTTGFATLALATLFAWSTTASAGTPSDVLAVKPGSAAAVSESLLLSRGLGGVPETAAIEADYGALAFLNEGRFGAATLGQAKSDAVRLASSSDEVAVAEPKDGDSVPSEKNTSNTEIKSDAKPPQNKITDTDYEALVNNAVGFGGDVSGGLGGQICRVTSLDDSGDGTLRDCATRGSTWVVFDVSGVIVLSSFIEIASNTTIDGRGADITITEHGLMTSIAENIIIHNLKIRDVEGDGINVFKAKDIWINHVTVGSATDGAIDITDQSRNVTVSWTHLKKQNKTMLIGNNDSKDDDALITVTLHHNWYQGTIRRNPTVRFGKVHMFNNVLTSWGDKFGDGDGVNAVYSAQVLLERNVFEAGANKLAVRTSIPGWLEVPGYIKARGNSPINRARVGSSQPDKVFEASKYYKYQLDPPNRAMTETVKTYAGWQPASFFESSVFSAEARESDADGN